MTPHSGLSLSKGVHYALAKNLIQQPDIIVRLTWYKAQMPKSKKQSLYPKELCPEDTGALTGLPHLLRGDFQKDDV